MVNPATLILVSQMSAVAYYSILVWDWIILLPREWRLIWKTEWSLYKGLYCISRYWTLFALAFSLWAYTASIDGATCAKVVNLVPAACAPIILSTECILAFRTYAIWQKKKWTLCIIFPLLLAELVLMILGAIAVKSAVPAGVMGPCLPLSKGNAQGITFAYWLSPFIVDSIFTSMSIYKAIQLSKVGQASNILGVFVREGILYFIVVSCANLMEFAFYTQPVIEMQGVCAFLALSASSLMCCRMVLSLRAFQDEHQGVGTGRIGTSGHGSADDTELSQRGHTKSSGSATPTPNGPMSSIFKLPSLAGGGRKNNRRGTNSQDVALDGVVVSVDRLEKSDGQIDSAKRGGNGRAMESDPEKGILQPRGSSLYSHEDRSDMGDMK